MGRRGRLKQAISEYAQRAEGDRDKMKNPVTVTRRDFLMGAGVALAGGVLAACTPQATPVPPTPAPAATTAATEVPVPAVAPTEAPTAAPAAEPISLELWLCDWVQDAWNQLGKEFADKYADSNVNTKPTFIPWQDLQTKALTSLAAGAGPDVLYNHPQWSATYLDKGVTPDLTPYIQAAGVDIKEYVPAAVDQLSWGGKIGAMPVDNEAEILFYNKDLLAAKGLADPHEMYKSGSGDWNYAKFVEYCAAVTEGEGPNKVYGSWPVMPDSLKMVATYLWGHGAEVFSPDYRETLIDSDKAVQAWEWMANLEWQGYVPTAAATEAVPDGLVGLANIGRVVFQYGIRGYLYQVKVQNPGMVVMPVGPSGAKATRAGIDALSVFGKSKNPDWAFRYCEFGASRGNEILVAAQAASPNRWATFSQKAWLDQLLPWEDAQMWEDVARNWERALPLPPAFMELDKIATEAQDKIRLKLAAATDAMTQAKQEIDRILQEGA